jgi:hypothetical protein
VPNPYQPSTGARLPFAGPLAAATLPRQNTLFPYPLLIGPNAAINRSGATADYHSVQARIGRRFGNGVFLDAHYTFSKEIDNTDTVEDNQNFNGGGTGRGGYDIYDAQNNRHIGFSDVPHRFVASFLYDLPFGEGKALAAPSKALRAIVGDWQMSGSFLWQSGFPIPVTGLATGAALARPDRVSGVSIELPNELQGWYDGRTTITLPSGRRITPPANSYLKYNPDAFAGRTVVTPSGRIVADQFWYGDAAIAYDEFRSDARWNLDLSIRRTIRLSDRFSIDIGADIMNVLNHTQFNGQYIGALGDTNLVSNPGNGQILGSGSANNFGTHNMVTFNPRQVALHAGVRF